jgi:hypothetical protein
MPVPARRLHPKRVDADAASSLDATVVAGAVAVAVASERFLTWTAYMAGDAFSLADMSAYTIEVFLSDQIDWSAHPHLKRGSTWSGVGRACPPSGRRTVVTRPAYGNLPVAFPRMRDLRGDPWS